MYSDLIYKMDELMIVSIKQFLKLPLQDKHFFYFLHYHVFNPTELHEFFIQQ